MKKKIQADLISIAHRILRAGEQVPVSQLQKDARELYEKLTLLNFAETHFSETQPTIGNVYEVLDLETIEIPETSIPEPVKVIEKIEEIPPVEEKKIIEAKEVIKEKVSIAPKIIVEPTPAPPKKEKPVIEPVFEKMEETILEEETEAKPEMIIEAINERVIEKDIFIPREDAEVAAKKIEVQSLFDKNDMEDIGQPISDDLPVFEKVNEMKPRSLNDRLKQTINIGLNDRLAFIKHLFLGSSADYNRVLSQLNTLNSMEEVEGFINTLVRPDYNFWEGKEEYEDRFMKIIRNKFD